MGDTLEEFLQAMSSATDFELFVNSTPIDSRQDNRLVFVYEKLHDSWSRTKVVIESMEPKRLLLLDNFFRQASEKCPDLTINPQKAVRIFIGHGRSPIWKDLKNHLTDLHKYQVIAYETGARAGHTIRDILSEMSEQSDIAFLVMTGEDELSNGSLQARPNVIHEVGLFQGKLGFSRAIVLLEEGCEEFSNLSGINQIRFQRGNIRETFGDILATIKREFQIA